VGKQAEKWQLFKTILTCFSLSITSGRQKCILVAHDWGGAVAWDFIQKHHDMVESYIIMDAPYPAAFYEVIKTNPKQFFCSL
jgi:pimeloyl-ACP methyl ester carboxylesterase